MESKTPFFMDITLWINILAIIIVVIAGKVSDLSEMVEIIVIILSLTNMSCRILTKSGIGWSFKNDNGNS